MLATISRETRLPRETPTKASAPRRASASVPCSWLALVMWLMASWPALRPSSPSQMMPLTSHMTTLPKPMCESSVPMAQPAAPAPLITILTEPICLPVTLSALIMAAATTIAVPC